MTPSPPHLFPLQSKAPGGPAVKKAEQNQKSCEQAPSASGSPQAAPPGDRWSQKVPGSPAPCGAAQGAPAAEPISRMTISPVSMLSRTSSGDSACRISVFCFCPILCSFPGFSSPGFSLSKRHPGPRRGPDVRKERFSDYLLSASMVLAAVRPETKISTMAFPPRRLPPWMPPVTSPAA